MRTKRFIPLFLLLFGSACEEEDPATTGPLGFPGCPVDTPCAVIAPGGLKENVTFTPIPEGGTLGLFDAAQGGVATWITVAAANVPPGNPKMKAELIGKGEPLNTPPVIVVPFRDGPEGIRYREGYMIQLNKKCCAQDLVGVAATLRVTLIFAGIDPIVTEVGVVLGDEPFPL